MALYGVDVVLFAIGAITGFFGIGALMALFATWVRHAAVRVAADAPVAACPGREGRRHAGGSVLSPEVFCTTDFEGEKRWIWT
jgi:hypothetical protein